MALLLVFGPPAVGKMTVGRALAAAGGYRLFHNHATIEPLIEVFDYGTPPFMRLLDEFRRRVLEEAAAADTDLVFTYTWALDVPEDTEAVRGYLLPYVDTGRRIALVELSADLDTRLARNRTPYRLAEKKSKRDVDWSDDNVRDLDRYQLNTDRPSPADALIAAHPHLRVDNTDRSPEDVAAQVLGWLDGE
ncbi:MAG: AAA family ATPase [Nocardioides sp.]|nr:AAA family ATPase [Nocardioides sp.]